MELTRDESRFIEMLGTRVRLQGVLKSASLAMMAGSAFCVIKGVIDTDAGSIAIGLMMFSLGAQWSKEVKKDIESEAIIRKLACARPAGLRKSRRRAL